MNRFRVLLVGTKDCPPSNLPAVLHRDSNQEMVAEAVTAVSDALTRLGEKGYDAAVCWADRTDELAGVIRIRKANPELPIMVLTGREEPGFEHLSRRAGATRTACAPPTPEALSECIRRSVQSGDLRRELRRQVGRVRGQVQEIRALTNVNRELVETARGLVQKRSLLRAPLLVEDDAAQASLLKSAFQKLGIATPLPVLGSGEDVIALLSKAGTYEALDASQPFCFALLDVELFGISGLDLLEWMGKQPRLRRVPVVMLSSSTEPEHIHRAFRLGAKSYLIKPYGFDALVRLVEGVHRFWGAANPSFVE